MMRNPEQTIGNLVDKVSAPVISYIDGEGYPVSRAMLAPREREGIRTFWFTTNTFPFGRLCHFRVVRQPFQNVILGGGM